MFDTSYYHGGFTSTNNVKINAVTGAILKNHPKSWFERFHLKSPRAEKLFKEGGHEATKEVCVNYDSVYGRHTYSDERVPEKDITVLQMVICGDMEVMAELVYTKDYKAKDEVKDARILELEKQLKDAKAELEKAYQVIGEVVDKPNPFSEE